MDFSPHHAGPNTEFIAFPYPAVYPVVNAPAFPAPEFEQWPQQFAPCYVDDCPPSGVANAETVNGDYVQFINPDVRPINPGLLESEHLSMMEAYHRNSLYPHVFEGLKKTVMCESWLQNLVCPFSPNCIFAHGLFEFEAVQGPDLAKPKSTICLNYTEKGLCPHGSGCLFIHPLPKRYQREHAPQQISPIPPPQTMFPVDFNYPYEEEKQVFDCQMFFYPADPASAIFWIKFIRLSEDSVVAEIVAPNSTATINLRGDSCRNLDFCENMFKMVEFMFINDAAWFKQLTEIFCAGAAAGC